MENNMSVWNKVCSPPPTALKQIKAGRLQGMTDINPQWRYMAITEVFGPCGIGWKYEIENIWLEHAENQTAAFATIKLYVKTETGWSDPIPGLGGSFFVAKEKSGPHVSDECYKMAITDALSVAMKMLGIGADIYAGRWDGSKYRESTEKEMKKEESISQEDISQFDELKKEADKHATSIESLGEWYVGNVKNKENITPTVRIKINSCVAQLKKSLEESAQKKSVECPESGKQVETSHCQGKPCRNGCPQFE